MICFPSGRHSTRFPFDGFSMLRTRCAKSSARRLESNRRRNRHRIAERLETRLPLDASFSFGGSTLTLNDFTEVSAEAVTISRNGDGIQVKLREGTFDGNEGNGATLSDPSTLRLDAEAVDGLTSIKLNDGSVGQGADPNVTLNNLDLADVALTINGAGSLRVNEGKTALFDSVLADVANAQIRGELAIDDDGSIKLTTERSLMVAGTLRTDAATIELDAGGRLWGGGTITTRPETGDGGNIKITTRDGANFKGTIDASGGDGTAADSNSAATVGGTGGNVTLSQVSGASSGVLLGDVVTNGGEGGRDTTTVQRAAAGGGDGGGITVTVNGNRVLRADVIESRGGVGGRNARTESAGGDGGTAGNISLSARSISAEAVKAVGGRGGASNGGSGGAGGSGGNVTLNGKRPGGEAIKVDTIAADGARGGYANTAGGDGGTGGDAGSISLTATDSDLDVRAVRANGGVGGDSVDGTGGNGGSGNTINASVGGRAVIQQLQSRGASAGTSESGIGGNGGSGGGVTLNADERSNIGTLRINGGSGGGPASGNGGDAGNATIKVASGKLVVQNGEAAGGDGTNNGGDGGTLTFTAEQMNIRNTDVKGGVGESGADGDDGVVKT